MNSVFDGRDIPLGFSMALAKNIPAMNAFSSMSQSRQREIIAGTKAVRSKKEMERYVDSINSYEIPGGYF